MKMCQVVAVFLLSPIQEPPLFFGLETKSQRCLKYIDCNYLGFRKQNRTVDSSNSPLIFHHNIRGLIIKTGSLINSLETNNISPDILSFSEHHLEGHLTLPLHIKMRFLLSKSTGGRCEYFCS